MKKIYFVLAVMVAFGILMGVIACASAETYAMTTVVVDIADDDDTVICLDFNDNEWLFTGVEDWQVGDVCSMLMDDQETDVIYDDVILDCRYSGWLEGWTERVFN